MDGAGKSETVNLLNAWMDPRWIVTRAFGAPSEEELERPEHWRFWRHLPRAGRATIFDRSWYGRVLVERVEHLASTEQWLRAYAEINAFERQLVEHGTVLLKFWLHITKEEQLRRFKAREQTPFKRWKITEEDWRNRDKWDQYETAVHDMVERTSTQIAPWILVEANDKKYARIKVFQSICEGLARSLK